MVAFCQLLTLPRHCRRDIETSLQTPRACDWYSSDSRTDFMSRIMLTSKTASAISSRHGLYLQSRHPVCFLDLQRQPCRRRRSHRA